MPELPENVIGLSAEAHYDHHEELHKQYNLGLSNKSINDLSDVDTTTSPPEDDYVLSWDGSNWVPAITGASAGGSASSTTFDSTDLVIISGNDVQEALEEVDEAIDNRSLTTHNHDGTYEPLVSTTTVADLGSAYAWDVTNKSSLDGTLTEACTLSFTGTWGSGLQMRALALHDGDQFPVTWPTISWPNDTEPDLDEFSIITVGTLDEGVTLFGMYDAGNTIETFTIALSDETTAISTTGTKVTWRAPYAFTLVAVRASLSTASSSGIPTFNIKEGGVSIFSTKLTIDANEKTSTTATTPAVISDATIADDAELTFDIDVTGTNAKGAKITLYCRRTT